MRNIFSGGLAAAALGTALIVASAFPASAQTGFTTGNSDSGLLTLVRGGGGGGGGHGGGGGGHGGGGHGGGFGGGGFGGGGHGGGGHFGGGHIGMSGGRGFHNGGFRGRGDRLVRNRFFFGDGGGWDDYGYGPYAYGDDADST